MLWDEIHCHTGELPCVYARLGAGWLAVLAARLHPIKRRPGISAAAIRDWGAQANCPRAPSLFRIGRSRYDFLAASVAAAVVAAAVSAGAAAASVAAGAGAAAASVGVSAAAAGAALVSSAAGAASAALFWHALRAIAAEAAARNNTVFFILGVSLVRSTSMIGRAGAQILLAEHSVHRNRIGRKTGEFPRIIPCIQVLAAEPWLLVPLTPEPRRLPACRRLPRPIRKA